MNEAAERRTQSVLEALALSGMSDSATVVLIGSSARGTTHARSDVDILIIHEGDCRIRLDRPGDIHLQQDSRSRFLRRLEDGDDYPGWALRFGIPIRDPCGWWAKQVTAESSNPHWPDWRPKVDHARKRIVMSIDLLDVGDVDAASEEMMFAASHVARAVLLQHGRFPLSRMELPSQLEDLEPDLAWVLGQLIGGDLNSDGLRSGEALLNSLINQL
jgi:hypothetical protein